MQTYSKSVSDCKDDEPSDGFTVRGVYYPTLTALARAYNIKITTLARRIHSKYWSLEQACELEPAPNTSARLNSKPLTVGKTEYPSMAAACAAHNVKIGVFHSRRRNGWSVEEALGIVPRKKRAKSDARPVSVGGIQYPSFRDACEARSLHPACVHSRLSTGWTMEEAFGLTPRTPPRKLSREEKSGKNGTIFIGGVPFTWKRPGAQP